jgi:N-acetyl-gamma-glutamyl-phosphate reductase
MARFKAAVIGGSGYGGGEIIRRLLLHPEVELVRVASIDYVGQPLSAAHPNLEGLTALRFEDIPPEEAAKGADVVLLGLPHKVAASFVARLVAAGVPKIVDLSGDFRLKDVAAYERFYQTTHPCPELLVESVYGLPELNREAIRSARIVASPGCFATATELSLLPIARGGWLSGVVRTVAATGSSGSGAAPAIGTHHPIRSQNLKTYKPLSHQHVPEIVETLAAGGARELSLHFVPMSAPLSRGIFATSFVTLPADVPEAEIAHAFLRSYEGEPFVRVPVGRLPEVVAVSGSNYVEVGFTYGPAIGDGTRTVTCFAAIDNLIKGGAGQAVQSMNLTLGLDERLTLRDAGGFP